MVFVVDLIVAVVIEELDRKVAFEIEEVAVEVEEVVVEVEEVAVEVEIGLYLKVVV